MNNLLITGSNGLVGQALKTVAIEYGYNTYFATRKDADLTKEDQVIKLYEETKPDCVIHTAARVGGIVANLSMPGQFFYENILMNSFMIHYACKFNVKKFMAFSSVCVFPDDCKVLKEDMMLQGEPYHANRSYGYSKRMIDVMLTAYQKQYGVKNYCSLIPGNIFGYFDNYNLRDGHILGALIHKLYIAKTENKPLYVWGDGSSEREFIYVKDLANCIFRLLELEEIPQRIIISGKKEVSIKEVVERLCKVNEFEGDVVWETDKPNGQKNRPTDISLLNSLIDVKYTDFDIALKESYEWFAKNYPNVRL